MTDIIIGHGEVGSALAEVLRERYEVLVHDPPKGLTVEPEISTLIIEAMEVPFSPSRIEKKRIAVEWLHICIPWSETFVEVVVSYIKKFRPQHVVIHSTVPVGTTKTLAEIEFDSTTRESFGELYPEDFGWTSDWKLSHYVGIIYSPVRGIHPHMVRYLREFPKWYAVLTESEAKAYEAHIQPCGIQTRRASSLDDLEWFKLIETTEYGYRIAWWQEIERFAEKRFPGRHGQVLSELKNWLYEKRKVYDGDRGHAFILYGGVIGGHCVKENWELLRKSGHMSPQLYRWLKESNEMRKDELTEKI